ncbi:MAG: hypothetical protein HAW67_06645 [Endozoicomonadaceae bacterium]|nr:hypothetical protein [Endozoicomonadaceae bacterium]
MNKRINYALKRLKDSSKLTENLLKTLSSTADGLSTKKSSSLLGTLGALVGAVIGISLGIYIPGFETSIISTVTTAIGAVVGTIGFRGSRGIQLDRMLDERDRTHLANIKLMETLPKAIPDEMRNDYWKDLTKLTTSQNKKIEALVSPTKNDQEKLLLLENKEDKK